jgi:ribonucleoside-diphosphate reductase alpha chain
MSTSIIDYIFRELAISYLDRDDLAQVRTEDLRHDTLGSAPRSERVARGVAQAPPAPVADVPSAAGPPAVPTAGAAVTPVAPLVMTKRDEARLRGYEGDACWNCGQFTLSRNGTCLKCDSCGETSGCS